MRLPQPLTRLVLFPAGVVLALVVIALTFGWLAGRPGDVNSLVDALGRGGNPQWRAAVMLAGALADPDNGVLKEDARLAQRLGDVLDRELKAGGVRADDITLRVYICRALGEFRVPVGLPVLVEAAAAERDPRELEVRRAAVEAIAVLASNVGPDAIRSRAEVLDVLSRAAADGRASLRSSAAFALGVLGGNRAEERLEAMLCDAHPDVRYNAATGLARHGNLKATDVLLDMLDPQQTAAMEAEEREDAKQIKQKLVLLNALRAVDQLARCRPKADLTRLAPAVERLSRDPVDGEIRAQAAEVQRKLAAIR